MTRGKTGGHFRLTAVVYLFAVIAVLCGCPGAARRTAPTEKGANAVPEEDPASDGTEKEDPKRIAVVRNLDYDDHTIQYFDGIILEGRRLGYRVDAFVTDADDGRMQGTLKEVIAEKYDGIIISHGKEEYSGKLIERAVKEGIRVVTFDTVFAPIEGVTSTVQNDEQLAKLSLDALIAHVGKKPAKIVKVWYDRSMSPFARRNAVYEEYERQGLIETVEEIYPQVPADRAQEEAKRQMENLEETEADGVWVAWGELAKGVYAADTGIPMVSIGISDADIRRMVKKPESWVAAAAVNPKTIGETDMRILDQKLRGEETPARYELEGNIIYAADLDENSRVSDLTLK